MSAESHRPASIILQVCHANGRIKNSFSGWWPLKVCLKTQRRDWTVWSFWVPGSFGNIEIIVFEEVALVFSWCSRMWERNVVSGALLEPEASADCYPLPLCWAELGCVCLLVYSFFFLLVLVLCEILGLVSRPSLCNILVGGSGLVFDLSLVAPFFLLLNEMTRSSTASFEKKKGGEQIWRPR